MKAHQHTEGISDEWFTPINITNALGPFDLDVCSSENRPWNIAMGHFTPKDDSLNRIWTGFIWCNPPFNRYERPKWMARMASGHTTGIMLIPAATETEAFFKHVWSKASAVCFVKSRPHFHFLDGTRSKSNCGTAIALCGYGEEAVKRLVAANLGKTIVL